MSMFIAFVLYGSLNTLSGLFTGSIEGLSADTVMVMPRYEMFGNLPYSHVNYIEKTRWCSGSDVYGRSYIRQHRKHDGRSCIRS